MDRKKAPLKNGTIVFFKKVRFSPFVGKKQEVEFPEGLGYGVFLGYVPRFVPAPPMDIIVAALSGIGYVKWDDVQEILGDDVMKSLMAKWQEKYTKRIEAVVKELAEAGVLSLSKPDGTPIPPGDILPFPRDKGQKPNPDGQDNPHEL